MFPSMSNCASTEQKFRSVDKRVYRQTVRQTVKRTNTGEIHSGLRTEELLYEMTNIVRNDLCDEMTWVGNDPGTK